MSRSSKLASAIALALGLASTTASAVELNYTLYSGVEHSDNIQLSSTQPQGESSLIPGFNFSLVQQGSTVQANVIGDVQYRHYLGGDYTDQTHTSLAGQVNWVMLPSRLDMTVEDFASVQPVDSLASNAPANLQQTNVFSVGPTVHFRLGETVKGQGELRYINSYAQKTKSFNSQRGEAALRLIKTLNPTDQISLNAESRRITFPAKYQSQGNTNYNSNELYARYFSKLREIDIDAALGWSRLNFDSRNIPSESSPLARLIVNWHATQRSTFGIVASRQYSDAAEGLMRQPAQNAIETGGGINGGTNTGNAVVNAQVYEERRAEVNYSFRTERLLFTLAPKYARLAYSEDPTFNQTARGGSVGLDYSLRPTLTLSVYVETDHRTYDTLDRRDRTNQYLITFSRQVNRHWSWRTNFSHQSRSSNASGQDFRENLIYVGVAYAR